MKALLDEFKSSTKDDKDYKSVSTNYFEIFHAALKEDPALAAALVADDGERVPALGGAAAAAEDADGPQAREP